MKVLIDTNVLLTYLSGREDQCSSACERIIQLCADERIEGVVAFHSLSTIWYVTRRAPEELRRGYIRQICLLLTISGANNDTVLQAIENQDFHDFEDALQDCCAIESGCDYIVTANTKDYSGHSNVPALFPNDFLALVSSK